MAKKDIKIEYDMASGLWQISGRGFGGKKFREGYIRWKAGLLAEWLRARNEYADRIEGLEGEALIKAYIDIEDRVKYYCLFYKVDCMALVPSEWEAMEGLRVKAMLNGVLKEGVLVIDGAGPIKYMKIETGRFAPAVISDKCEFIEAC